MKATSLSYKFGPDRKVLGDALARMFVCGVESLDELLDKWPAHGYRPTIFVDEPRRELLADCYDRRAMYRGIDVVAYRCGKVAL